VDVACRVGPGSIYDRVFLLRRGQTADLVGRSADESYLIIRNPNRPQQLCWVERGALQINRLTGNLPVMTPPPPPTPTRTPTRTPRPPSTSTFTPTITVIVTSTETATLAPVPNFDMIFSGLDDCATTPAWWVNFEVGNTGELEFESVSITITDNDTLPTPTELTLDSDLFISSNGCNAPLSEDTLPIGFSVVLSSAQLSYDPTGHHIDAEVMLCTEELQGGECVTKMMSVIP
jgi:hypothetical protein